MTKLQLLHRALNERLMAAVEQIMEMVGGTVLEYEEETIRARKENEVLRRRLRWMEGANPADWPGPSEPITLSTPDESNPSQQDESAVNFGFEKESGGFVIKTETTDHPLYSGTTLPQGVDQGSDIAGTSTGVTYGLAGGITWDSGQSYMEPLDFDPTSGTTRVRHWRGRNRKQRMSFACPDCGKVFGREQRLLIHMRIHSTERPYKYRRRKAFFYGDNKKKRKLHSLSQLSREIVDDLSDCSEQTDSSNASPERLAITSADQEDPGGQPPENDHTSSDKEPETRETTLVHHKRKKKREERSMQCHCPHCPNRVFARPCQLAMHMKTHMDLVNIPSQPQSGTDEIMDVKMKSSKVTFLSKRCFSKVWDYFSKDPYGDVVCHQCSARVSQGSSKASQKNTSNLWSHLRINHRHAFLEAKGHSRPVNFVINSAPIKLENFEPGERFSEGESGIMKVLNPEEPTNGNL